MTTSIREEMKLEQERRNRFLSNLIKEAIVNTIAEQAVPPVMPDPMAGNQPAAPAAPAPGQPTDTNPQAPGAQEEEFTLDKMIEKLNVIRGGRSFTDPEIYGQLTTMFKTWDPQTKQLIEKTFDEIAKVVTLNAQAEGQPEAGNPNPPNPTNPQPNPGAAAPSPMGAPGGAMPPVV